MSGQSWRHSWFETITNTAIGFVVALASQIVVFPIFGIHVPFSTNIGIGIWFTAISIVRGFLVRRAFNSWHSRPERQ
jgi:hypothetical protein